MHTLYKFSVRLETAFGESSLAFPTDCFVVIRILTTIVVICGNCISFAFTCGVPWNVYQHEATDNHPALCRNVVQYQWYWDLIHIGGVFMLLSAHLMNWIGLYRFAMSC